MKVITTFVALLFISVPSVAQDFTSVYSAFRKAECQGCHATNGVAAATRFNFPEEELAGARVDSFGLSLQALVDRTNPEESLLFKKPTARVPHAGGRRIAQGSAEEAALLDWIKYLASVDPSAIQPMAEEEKHDPVGPVLRRLTHNQYDNTIRDLLGDDSRLGDRFPAEDFVNGFRNQYQAQAISPLLAESYSAAAEKLASKAFGDADSDGRGLIPCKPASATDAACRDRFIREFGKRTFRRPLEQSEIQRYAALFHLEAERSGKFLTGARIVAEAMLQSPNFLLRAENGLERKWQGYETASRLSYMLWNTMPDEALFRSAESGELDTPEGVERVARRMLKDPKARQAMNDFVTEWLRFDRVLTAVKDRRAYAQFSPELAFAMTQETQRFVADLIWGGRNFMDFYTADYSFLSSNLAALYGAPAPEREYQRVSLPGASGRAGILGQASFLSLTSSPSDTSPTARGLFVREQFLCQEVPQPPPGVSTNLPPLTEDKPRTNKERLAVHLSNEGCASCHTLIDPIGFGLEKYDAIGQFREKLKLTFRPQNRDSDRTKEPKTAELELDTRGYVAGIRNSEFSNPRELGKVLASSAQCQECVVKQLFRYSAGRHELPADRVVIRKAFEEFRESGFQFQELLVSLTKWMVFPEGKKTVWPQS